MTATPPDEIDTAAAAALLGVSGAMFRRLAGQGFITRHARGKTSVSSAVQGYAQFLRSGAERTDANEAQSRAHRAKAAKVARATARRRANLIERAEGDDLVDLVSTEATKRLRAVDLVGLVDGATARAFAAEVEGAVGRIETARVKVIAGLRGDGGDDDDD